ncbi:hypothetical protein BOSP111201_22245 [Bordetella sputigena]
MVLSLSTAGGADLVVHANQDTMANAMAATPPVPLAPSMSPDVDCTVAAIPSECQRRARGESAVIGRKMVLWTLVDGERAAARDV